MLMKLEVNFKDYMGHSIKKCSILKCHKREGEAVDYGDALLDIRVEELLIPSSKAATWHKARWLNERPSGAAEMATAELQGSEPIEEQPKGPRGGFFAAPLVSYRRLTAAGRGILRKSYSEEGTPREMGDPLALLTTDERESVDGAGALAEAAPFRVVMRPLDLDVVLETMGRRAEIVQAKGQREYRGKNFITFWSETERENRIGVYMRGGCHLALIFPCKSLIHRVLRGTCSILHHGMAADSHTGLLLQSLRDDFPQECLAEVISKLSLPPDYFQPRLFERTFTVTGLNGPEEYPKNLVVLDLGPDTIRMIYRHRQYGFLVDPGGGWLNEPLENTLNDLSVVNWFRKNFVKVGQISVEQHFENLAKIITLVKKNTGAHILILNNLTVEPNSTAHNYQFVKNPQTTRRLEFNLALVELSRKLDVFILDADRILKRVGIRSGRDWNHFHPEVDLLLGQQAFHIMHGAGVV